jgi:dinuclear metal center YbgI/SA1388 family protein
MTTVGDVCLALARLAPEEYAFEFDRVGLQVGDRSKPVDRILVSLDHSANLLEAALVRGAQMVITHHPLIFQPISSLEMKGHVNRLIFGLIESGIAHACAHTNWDCAEGGVNDELARRLGLVGVVPIGSSTKAMNWKMVVFCPAAATHAVIDAAADAGAGVIGAYERCAFLTEGTGTFRGKSHANPSIGMPGQIETVEEHRVEMVVQERDREAVDAAVRKVHPYEEPAIDWLRAADKVLMPIARLGSLPQALPLREFVRLIDDQLDTRSIVWGEPEMQIEKVAVCGGACDDFRPALGKADVWVTGEVKQHNGLEAPECGVAMIAAGHYATEQPGVEALANALRNELPSLEIEVYTPPRGTAGRPWW